MDLELWEEAKKILNLKLAVIKSFLEFSKLNSSSLMQYDIGLFQYCDP